MIGMLPWRTVAPLALLLAACGSGAGGPTTGDDLDATAATETGPADAARDAVPDADATPEAAIPPDAGPPPRVTLLEPARGTFATNCAGGTTVCACRPGT